MANPLDPMANTHASEPPQVSKKTFPIAGIATTVFGLDELPSQASTVACLWLLHPRLATQERMTGIAATIITDWNKKLAEGQTGSNQGLIAVSFDQRNHGTRLVEPLANEAWKQGNPRHAQDMFSIFRKWSPGACRSHSMYGVNFFKSIDYRYWWHFFIDWKFAHHWSIGPFCFFLHFWFTGKQTSFSIFQLTHSNRGYRSRHLASTRLSPVLHLPQIRPYYHNQSGPRRLPRRPCLVELYPPRTPHHSRRGHHRLS